MSGRMLITAPALAFLAGCASHPVFEGDRRWDQGWREGVVEKVGAASELGYRQSYDCRYRDGGAGRSAAGAFAVVGVRDMGRHRHHVVPLAPGTQPQAGAPVLTNWRNCEPPLARNGR